MDDEFQFEMTDVGPSAPTTWEGPTAHSSREETPACMDDLGDAPLSPTCSPLAIPSATSQSHSLSPDFCRFAERLGRSCSPVPPPLPSGQLEEYAVHLDKQIGRGAFGNVYLSTHMPTDHVRAVKVLAKTRMTDKDHTAFQQEIRILERHSHPHILPLTAWMEDTEAYYLVSRYMSGGDLFAYMQRHERRLDEPHARSIFGQVASGVDYLHRNSIAHLDLKLDNVLIDDSGHVAITDFGLSQLLSSPSGMLNVHCGSPSYLSPEMLRGQPYVALASDVWSSGVLLYTLLTATFPFAMSRGKSRKETYRLVKGGRYALPEYLSGDACDLLRGMLCVNSRQRLTIAQVCCHRWLTLGCGVTGPAGPSSLETSADTPS